MKIGVLSDIHANLDALKLVLTDMEKNNIDEIICLGDLVTKYFYPKEVVDIIRDSSRIVIKGNCDDLVSNDDRYKFARAKLGIDRIEYLDNLPTSYSMIHNNINFKMYHATPDSLDKIFNPLFSYNQYTSYKDKIINDPNDMFKTDKEVILYGHTHQCFVGGFINSKFKLFMNQAILDSNSKVIINVGSSGEHNHMVCFNNIVETYIDSYLTYLILEDIDNIVFAHLKYVPYKETLKKVYLDILKKEKESLIPYSPKDKEKIYKSLRCMRQI